MNNQLGIGGSQPIPGLTEVRIGNNVANIGTTGGASNTNNGLFQINERLTWLKGRHTMKFGGSWNYYVMERYYAGNNGVLGYIAYGGAYTRAPNASTGGAAVADFLLDQVSGKGRGSLSEPWTHLQSRTAVYAADDFKATDDLTLNLGLRWGYTSPLVEKDDRQANFSLVNAEQQLAGQNGNSRALYEPYYKGWEPRLGFAYRQSDRWVFRGGYGITQYMEGTGANLRLPLNPPFFFESQIAYAPPGPASTIATGFEGLQALDRPSGQLRAWDPNLRPQFTQQWNAYAEYLLGSRSSINVGYVGSKSKYLVTPIEGNQPLPGTGPASTWRPIQERRPLYAFNPLITNISTTASRGRADYKALQTTFKQRLWKGLDFVANYTLGEANSNNLGYYGSGGVAAEGAYPVNSNDIEANYGPAFFDARHIFSLAGSYELPFGKDRRVRQQLEPRPRCRGRRLGAELCRHRAQRLSDHRPGRRSEPAVRRCRPRARRSWPDLIGDPVPTDQSLTRWLNRDAFRSAALGTFGNAGVGIVRAPELLERRPVAVQARRHGGAALPDVPCRSVQPAQPSELRPAGSQHPEPDVRHDHQHRRRRACRAAGAEILLLATAEVGGQFPLPPEQRGRGLSPPCCVRRQRQSGATGRCRSCRSRRTGCRTALLPRTRGSDC